MGFIWMAMAGVGVTVLAGLAYQREIAAARERQRRGSRVLHTMRGPIEFAMTGEGPPLLIAHSAMGGYDQGLATAQRFPGFRVIAPSRAGYLRTPLTTGPDPEAMADAFAALLDAQAVPAVITVGWSAGAMSAIAFALRHPNRCRALILGSPITQPPPAHVLNVFAAVSLSNRSDFLNWLISSAAAAFGLPLIERDPQTRAIMRAFTLANPASDRFPGFEQDITQMRHFTPPLEAITIPTFIIHGGLDILVPLDHARSAAQRIPGARLLVIPGGQHDCPIRYPEIVGPALQAFLDTVM
jgi:2-hydroxy-6-oxonona-2,4-dienedioate hydrolase